ncbi:MAG: gliding motility-associated C-terminal domain-containing protein [bacterium]|nr:gliding motility-associated C-terminal domain-containing protein [bacterium]
MKKLVTVTLVLLTSWLSAQTSCQNAKPFCAGGVSGITFPASTNITSAQLGPSYGCLGSTPNPSWYFLQISNSGNLDILIQGQIPGPPPGPGQDVDFICWGPFNSLNGICDSLNAGKIVDCSYSGSFTETLNIPNGITGQYYMVLITNFANITQNIIFSQYAGTGSTNCGLVSSNTVICGGSSATLVTKNTGSLTGATYSINPGGTTNSTGSFVVAPLVTSVYTLYITGVNNLSVVTTQTASSTVTVNSQPNAVPTITNSTCTSSVNAFNLGLTFTPVSPVPGYTVTWASIPPGILSATQTTLTGGIPGGPYSATITAAGGCSVLANFSVAPEPEPATITLNPLGNAHILTCLLPVLTLTSMVATNNYTWSNGLNAPFTGQFGVFTFTSTGTWTINSSNPNSGCISSRIVSIGQNTVTPTATVAPVFQNITCTQTAIATITAVSTTTVNVSHTILSPLGVPFSSNTSTVIYTPGVPGTYTHCVVNDANGCSSCRTFSVFSNQGFPTFLVSSPQNFTLGCNTTSVATINIYSASATNTNQVPTGGPVSYTLLSPGASTSLPSGILSSISTYTVNTPGTWTVVTKDNTSFCATRIPISILQNTFAPDISAIVERQILNCNYPKVTLKGQSTTNNIAYIWGFPGTPGTQPGDSIVVSANTLTPTNTLVANYTLTITDNSSTCKSTTVIPILQNLFPPKAIISNGGTSSLTCVTGTVMLTNQSTTGIPPGTPFSSSDYVIGYLWDGPSPQTQGQVSSTYLAATVGIYTLTVKDLNNGCMNTATTNISDNRIYPVLNNPITPAPFVLDCGAKSRTITPNFGSPTTGFVYAWTTVPGATVSGANTGTLTTNMMGTYKVLVTNAINGCASSGEVSVINGTLNAAVETDHDKGYAPFSVLFSNISSSSIDNAGITTFWSFGNGTSSVTASANLMTSALYNHSGTYKVTLFVTKGSCMDTVIKTIYVEIPSDLEVPNVFTPNGDNVNDIFFLKASNLTEIHMFIFDRWGQKVYEINSTSGNISWDGKNQNGKEVADGTYYYTLKASGKDGLSYDKNGTISLIR